MVKRVIAKYRSGNFWYTWYLVSAYHMEGVNHILVTPVNIQSPRLFETDLPNMRQVYGKLYV